MLKRVVQSTKSPCLCLLSRERPISWSTSRWKQVQDDNFLTEPTPDTPWTEGQPMLKHELQQLLSHKPHKFILLDVREPDEWAEGTIPTAKTISLQHLFQALRLSDMDFKNKYGFPKPHKEDHVVVYCRSGKRSALAQQLAYQLGYKRVRNYIGSWLDWTQP